MSTDLLAPRVLIQGLTSHFREAEPARSALPPPLPVSHRGVCNLSHVPPRNGDAVQLQNGHTSRGSSALLARRSAQRRCGSAAPRGCRRPPAREGHGSSHTRAPHRLWPATRLGDASSSLSKGSWVTFCSGLAWGCWGPGLTALPASPTPYLASVCPFVSHVFFAKCKSVCLVCSVFLFFNPFMLSRLRVKVHVHSGQHRPPGYAVPLTKLVGPAHAPKALA